ncbi:uncharacterized protein LOC62_05G007146 [Vanrija pseudolonga]|uniref:Uncharacterized protein n=1 Tax=Vanrija pseudolonga TaxID=143232 RepID=A0AAF0YFH2_9TREE|nr:hypothetical protein LOC62_05G007146 [Vanrija pseudolonga]
MPTDEYPEDPPPRPVRPDEPGTPGNLAVNPIPRKAHEVKRRNRRRAMPDTLNLRQLVLKKMAYIRHSQVQEARALHAFECLHGVESPVEEEIVGLESPLVEYYEGEEIQEYDSEPAACDSMVF